MAELKEEQRKIAKQAEEVSVNRIELEGSRLEIQKDIDELVVLIENLKVQREQLVKEREQFIAFAEKLKNCNKCGEMICEFMPSGFRYLHDMVRREILPLPKVAEDYMVKSIKGIVHPFELRNDRASLEGNIESPTLGKSVSWLVRKCTEKICNFSPIKRGEPVSEETNPVDQDADAELVSDRDDIAAEAQDESFDVQRAQTIDNVRELEGGQDHLVGGLNNTLSGNVPAASQHSDLDHQPAKTDRGRPTRTHSVNSVMKDAKDILGDSVEENAGEYPNGDAEDSTRMDGGSKKTSSFADMESRRKGRKRDRVYNSQTSEHDDGKSEEHSHSVVAGGPRTRRQKVVAAGQGPAKRQYNLRRPRNVDAETGVTSPFLSRKAKNGNDDVREVRGNSRPRLSHSVGVVSDNGGSVNLLQAEGAEVAQKYSTLVPNKMVESRVLSDEGNGTPDRHVGFGNEGEQRLGSQVRYYVEGDEDENDDDEEEDEEEHPGEASIGKKLWKFLTT